MKNALLVLLHLAVMAAELCRRGGVRAVIAENLLLKRQLIVLRRGRQRAPHLTRSDRVLCGFSSLFLNPRRIQTVAIAFRPSTLLAFHRALVHRKYQRLFSSRPVRKKPGPRGPDEALVRAIVELKSRNPRFGCPRIARIIWQTFGIDIDKNLVHRVLAKHYRPTSGGTGPSWLSFIGHTTNSLWSIDLFRCESIVLRSYWVLVVMDQCTRRLVGVAVHCGTVTGADVCRMFNAAIRGHGVPRHVSTDHDPVFEAHRWVANLRILEIDEIKTVPHVPLSHPFVERLVGTMRREFLDHVLFWNARDLERKLAEFQIYYNAARGHASLSGRTPLTFVSEHAMPPADLNHVRWVSHCRGLVQLPSLSDMEFETHRIYWQAADGSGSAERLSPLGADQAPMSFSRDDTQLLFSTPIDGPADVGVLTLGGERRAEMLLNTRYGERNAEVSPDGNWLAYQSNESNTDEVYVRPFPDVTRALWPVSAGGGTRPLWSRDGRELFYYVEPGTIMAVPVELGKEPRFGRPSVAVKGMFAAPVVNGRHYDVSPDGKRFLLLKDVQDTKAPEPPQLILVQHWGEELKRLVPAK